MKTRILGLVLTAAFAAIGQDRRTLDGTPHHSTTDYRPMEIGADQMHP